MKRLSEEQLKKVKDKFSYNPETGEVMRIFKKCSKPAITQNPKKNAPDYDIIPLFQYKMKVCDLIYYLQTGKIADFPIKRIDKNKGYEWSNVRQSGGYWHNKEEIIEAAEEYQSKKQFQNGNNAAYSACRKNFPGLIDELFENQLTYWSEGDIREAASHYSTRNEFRKGCSRAYRAGLRSGIIDDLGFIEADRCFWSKEEVYLYTVRIDTPFSSFLKVGISSEPDERYTKFGGDELNIIPLDCVLVGTGKEAYTLEQAIHKELQEHHIDKNRAIEEGIADGFTECFSLAGYAIALKKIEEFCEL